MVSCGGGGGKSAYYGTWKNNYIWGGIDPVDQILTISSNSISFKVIRNDIEVNWFDMEDLTWLPIDNSNEITKVNFPTGYEVRGTVKRNRGFWGGEHMNLAQDLLPKLGNEESDGKIHIFIHNNGGTLGISPNNNSAYQERDKNWNTLTK